jgi:peptidoglycan hydrolase-like protein with peptidoglycan-binding domain
MRMLGLVLAAMLAAPAFAQAPAEPPPKAVKTVPVKPAPATPPNPIAGSYAALPQADRVRMQQDLIWTGDYNGVASGEFGERAIAAVKAFQGRNGGKQTGVLNPQERGILAANAKTKQEAVGWRGADDSRTGARLGLPAKLVPEAREGKSGTLWKSARGEVQIETFRMKPGDAKQVFEQLKKEPSERKTDYSVLRSDFFVLTGLQGLKKFYVRAHFREDEIRGVTIMYDQGMEPIMGPVVIAMSSAYAAFPSGTAVAAPVKRRVEYATGVVVSPSGHILTDSEATEGCYALTVSGHGGADRVATDKANGLALLRVYGLKPPKPLQLGSSGAAAEALLVGIADPQAQDGGKAVSTTRARFASLDGARMIEPAPVAGFAGAAAVDAQGQLIGVAAPRNTSGSSLDAPARTMLVPVETIRSFLDAQQVTPASEAASLDGAKQSVVRVICVRK